MTSAACPCGGKIIVRDAGTFDGQVQRSRECDACGRWFNVRVRNGVCLDCGEGVLENGEHITGTRAPCASRLAAEQQAAYDNDPWAYMEEQGHDV